MPSFSSDYDTQHEWESRLSSLYRDEVREFDPERVHVSDLISCLRRPFLTREYEPSWNLNTLYMFTLGRAFEKAVFTGLLPESTEELEVLEGGIVGHIDFGTDDLDYECKLTWKREPQSEDEVDELFEKSQYWVDQAGTYAIMRRRRACRFAVLHIPTFPQPSLRIYRVEWTAREQAELWKSMTQNREYVVGKEGSGELPMKTLDTKLCQTCQVKEVCDAYD